MTHSPTLALRDALSGVGVPVMVNPPAERPASFIRVSPTGGPPLRDVVVSEATVAWEAWAETLAAAEQLAFLVRDTIDSAAEGATRKGVFIAESKSSTPAWFPDESGKPRFVGTATIYLHEI